MNLAVFLALGDSFENMEKSGQDVRFKKYYLHEYSKNFKNIFIFSYNDEKVLGLPKNVVLVPNKFKLPRYIYGLLLPFLNKELLETIDRIRAFHLSGTVPAVVSKVFFKKSFIFNFAYDYQKFSKMEGKYFQLVLFKVLQPLAIFYSSKIFAANKEIYKSLPRMKAVYLPNGVDTRLFKPYLKGSKNSIPLILSVGRLEKQKNFDKIIYALKGENIKLKILGNGNLKNYMKNLAKTLKVNLEIIEKVPNTIMPLVYRKAEIFVLPSITEGSSKVLIEAMACGQPVIASDIDENREIVQDGRNGLLVEDDLEVLKAAIKKLLKSPKLRKDLGRNARKAVDANFNLNSLLKKEIKNICSL